MKSKINITNGDKFGRLTILKETDRGKHNKIRYLCLCDCGVECIKLRGSIISGCTISCGCYQRESTAKRFKEINKTHGLTSHPLFNVWRSMKKRCYLKSHEAYVNYGGRGITVCDEWYDDFKAFHDWCIANGWQKGLEVDRYPNNDGNYEPSNCRITTTKKNNNNKRTNVSITYNGETKTATEWSEIYGGHRSNVSARIKKGLSPEESIFGVGKSFETFKNKK